MGIIVFLIIAGGFIYLVIRRGMPAVNDCPITPKSTTTKTTAKSPEIILNITTATTQPQPEAQDQDAWEGTFRDGINSYPTSATLQFEYTDGRGTKSKRVVDVREADDDLLDGMFMGYCRLRNATRTFRYDRVESCVDTDTGECITDIQSHLYNKYLLSPEYAVEQFEEENKDLVKCLLHIGKADGQLRKNEISIITETCMMLTKNVLITENAVGNLLAAQYAPSLQAFKIAVGRVATSGKPSHIAALMLASNNIVKTQKTVHPSEQVAIDYINKKYLQLEIDINKEPYCSAFTPSEL